MKKVYLLLITCLSASHLLAQTGACPTANAGPDFNDATDAVTIGPPTVLQGATYSWSPTTLLSDPNVANPTVTRDPNGGSYTYVLTMTPNTSANLITNGNFAQGNAGFSSSYTYISPGTLGAARQYTVAPNPRVMNSQWCEFTGTDNVMAIDGSTTANVPFWSQTVAVRPNTTHLFSYQAMLLYSGEFNLGVSINGVAVSSKTLKSRCIWSNFSLAWNSGSSTTATITLYSLSNLSVGNDFAVDNIRMLAACPTTTDAVTVNFRSPCSNLVANSDFSQGNTGFSTQYTYVTPGTAGTQSRYTITPNPRVMNSQWCTYTGTDNVMAIDGATTANLPFWSQTITVTPNTNYAFGFESILLWPDAFSLGASINGVPIVTQALTNTCARQPINATWNSGSSTSAIITIYSTTNKSVGNDFAIDNVRFARVCPTATAEVAANIEPLEINIYPNPAQQQVTIQLTNDTAAQIEIRNSHGKLVRTATGSSNIPINIEDLPKGIYTISIRSNEDVTTKRLIIE